MGYKLRQRTKSIIEYDKEKFNGLYEELSMFLSELDIKVYKNEDYWKCWEIERSEVKKIVEYLGNCEPDKVVLGDYTANDLKKVFENYLAVNEKEENFSYPDYIYLDWF